MARIRRFLEITSYLRNSGDSRTKVFDDFVSGEHDIIEGGTNSAILGNDVISRNSGDSGK